MGELQVFLRVVEAGSFSEAARLLHMTPSTISKLIGRMETRLGVRLMERSTRRLALTDEGKLLHDRGIGLVADFDDFEQEISGGGSSASGTVKVNASVGFGTIALVPLLPAFWAVHPGVVIDLSLSDKMVDLYDDRTDIAFRIGALGDSAIVARKIGIARRKIVASPAYLARSGTPRILAELDQHNCLGFNFSRAAPVWPLREGGTIINRMVGGTLMANNGETVRHLAVAGAGLARLADYHVRDDIAAGRLVEVLAEAECSDHEDIHALYLGGPLVPQRIRLFLDFVVPRLQVFLRGDAADSVKLD